ncbi:hypothetical protein [Luteolibacter marinus]|uniref:hypothetical protein n=1 Tax=Luteolibacter marinus TaxID=2776705 RepID=UPI001867A47F|nr:hypothetical protein [Luteolibacter marinus]
MKACWIAASAVTLLAPVRAEIPPPSETGVMLQAAELLPAEVLRGTSYRVRDQVPTDGYLAHFTIDSDFGTFQAAGAPQAKRRIAETEAIRKLVETSKSDLFAAGLKKSVEQPIDAVKAIVANPVDSVKQAPKTVGHFFGKIGRSIGRGAGKVADQIGDVKDNPGETDASAVAAEAGRETGEAAKSAVGFDMAKLRTAKELGVDPYSDNPRLQEEMDKVTWAFFAGGMPLRIVTTVASGGIALAATEMVGIPEDTYALTASELALRDEDALAAMGVAAEDIKAFMIHRPLSVTRRHLVVTCLQALPNAAGRGHIVQLANACTSPEQADFLISALELLAGRQRSGAADYVSLQVLGRLPGAGTRSGELHVPAPVDHVTWTDEVRQFAIRDDLGDRPKVLLHTGRLSSAATAGLTAAGWKTVGVNYPAAP